MSSGRYIPPLIKWTGSKRSQACTIAGYIPDHRRYFEPFVGGGALLYIAGKPGSVAGDVYAPLIALWRNVRDDHEAIVADYERQWIRLQDDFPRYYYIVRDRFNRSPNPYDLNFLSRTCVNGIIRFNREGKFNNSLHLSRRGMIPERFGRVVKMWRSAIAGIDFVCQDYEETLSAAKDGDFVYFDPPYAGSRKRYIQNLGLERFFRQLAMLNQRGVKWALSFDGRRGGNDLTYPVPNGLYRRKALIPSGQSAVHRVLNGPIERVDESLYLNY